MAVITIAARVASQLAAPPAAAPLGARLGGSPHSSNALECTPLNTTMNSQLQKVACHLCQPAAASAAAAGGVIEGSCNCGAVTCELITTIRPPYDTRAHRMYYMYSTQCHATGWPRPIHNGGV